MHWVTSLFGMTNDKYDDHATQRCFLRADSCVMLCKAEAGQYRLSESALCMTALSGGWVGGMAAMNTFRHKTKKESFQVSHRTAHHFTHRPSRADMRSV